MKKAIIILSLVFSNTVYGQFTDPHLFSDTSLYFIQQADSLRPVELTATELVLAEQLLAEAVEQFVVARARYLDSLFPGRRKERQASPHFTIEHFFRLVPGINKENQRTIRISGVCKDLFRLAPNRSRGYGKDWKQKFVNEQTVLDGGSCFIYLNVNLTLKTHDGLRTNSEG